MRLQLHVKSSCVVQAGAGSIQAERQVVEGPALNLGYAVSTLHRSRLPVHRHRKLAPGLAPCPDLAQAQHPC